MANLSDILTNYQSVDTLDSVTDRGATTTNAITIGNLTSTGIDDNATSTAVTLDTNNDLLVGTASLVGTSGGANLQNIQVAVDGTARMLISDTGTGGKTFGFYTASGLGGIYNYTDANYDLVIDGNSNSIAIGTNANVSTLTGNVSGVGTSSKFKVVGSVGETQIANTGNLIAFSRNAANYISATGSTASLIYDSKEHYLRDGSENFLILGTNSTTSNKFARTQEVQYEDSTVRESARFVEVASYWTNGEYVEICEVDPGGSSQNYTINAKMWATNGQVGENLDIEFRVRSNTLPAITHYCVYEKTRAGTSFGLEPKVWYDSTNGVIKLVVKNTAANIHCADFKVTVQARSQSQARDNVTIGTGAEITTGVPSGYTESSALETKNTYYNGTWQGERKPALPAMSAKNTGVGSWTSVNSGVTETLGFNTTDYNQASFFNTGNGRFTVSVSGIYNLAGQIYGKLNSPNTSSGYWGAQLFINGAIITSPWLALEGYYNGGDYDLVVHWTRQVYLSTNDYVEIKFKAVNVACSYYSDNNRFQAVMIG